MTDSLKIYKGAHLGVKQICTHYLIASCDHGH